MLIIGVGNPLMGDDGIGPFVLRTLSEDTELSRIHRFVDAGTDSFTLLDLLRDAVEDVLILDCGDFRRHTGDILHLDMNDKRIVDHSAGLELHACSLPDLWKMARMLNPKLKGALIAIKGERILPGQELSREIISNLNYIKETIKGSCQRHD